jgi:hypothetical protein
MRGALRDGPPAIRLVPETSDPSRDLASPGIDLDRCPGPTAGGQGPGALAIRHKGAVIGMHRSDDEDVSGSHPAGLGQSVIASNDRFCRDSERRQRNAASKGQNIGARSFQVALT